MQREVAFELLDNIDEDIRQALIEGNWKRIEKLAHAARKLEALIPDE